MPFRTSRCYKETALVVRNCIRFRVYNTGEKGEVIHRHCDFTRVIGIQRLRPIVVRGIWRGKLEQIRVKFKSFNSITCVNMPCNFVAFCITISAAKTPHHLLEAHRNTVVFLTIPCCDTVEVCIRTREEFGDIAELVVSFRWRERIAVLLLKCRHLIRIFKEVFPVDVPSSIHLRR